MTCQTECRCALSPQKPARGPRMDPINLLPYLPQAKWSPGPGDQGWHAMLCQVLKESQKCTRRCVVLSLFFVSWIAGLGCKKVHGNAACWQLLLSSQGGGNLRFVFILLLPGCEKRGARDTWALVCSHLAVLASVPVRVATFLICTSAYGILTSSDKVGVSFFLYVNVTKPKGL